MWCFCPASSVPGMALGSQNWGASGICGFCQPESPVIHIDSSAKKGLWAIGRAHEEEQRLRAVQQLMRTQSDVRPAIKETGFSWTMRNFSIRGMLIFIYFTPFLTEKWRAYARPKFFFYKEKNKQLWENSIDLLWVVFQWKLVSSTATSALMFLISWPVIL